MKKILVIIGLCLAFQVGAQVPAITDNSTIKFNEGTNSWMANALALKTYMGIALPAGSGSELQFRFGPSSFGAVTGSSVSGADITLSGVLKLPSSTSTAGRIEFGSVRAMHFTGGADNTFVGLGSGNYSNTGTLNTAIGSQSLQNVTSGQYNNAFGYFAGRGITTGSSNLCIGIYSLYQTTSGYNNIALGATAMQGNTVGFLNTSIGYDAMRNPTSSTQNVAIGGSAMAGAGNSASQNVVIGTAAGAVVAGNGNVFIGFQAGAAETGSNKLYISNSNTSTPLVYGDFSTGRVGIGVIPTAGIDALTARIRGTFFDVTNSAGTAGDLITNTGSGLQSKSISAALGGLPFLQGGNSFAAAAMLGTNDNNDLQFETNNTYRGRIAAAGNWIVGGASGDVPLFRLDVRGTSRSAAHTLDDATPTDPNVNAGEWDYYANTSPNAYMSFGDGAERKVLFTHTIEREAIDYNVNWVTGRTRAFFTVPAKYAGLKIRRVILSVNSIGTGTNTILIEKAGATQTTNSITTATTAVTVNQTLVADDIWTFNISAVSGTPPKGLTIEIEITR